MISFFRKNALLLGLPVALLLSAGLFHSRAPRTQSDLVVLEHLTNKIKSAFPAGSPRKIIIRGLSPDYAIWTRYLAAPQPVSVLPPAPGDTVLVVERRDRTPTVASTRVWQVAQDSFRVALEIWP